MIAKMKKLTFLVYHKEYDDFVKSLRDLGLVHIQEFQKGTVDDSELHEQLLLAKQVSDAIKRLERFEVKEEPSADSTDGKLVLENLEILEKKLADLKQEISALDKTIEHLSPWGDFKYEDVRGLKDLNLEMNFFVCSESAFNSEWVDKFNATLINRQNSRLYFITITEAGSPLYLEAESIKLPSESLSSLIAKHDEFLLKAQKAEEAISVLASTKLISLKEYLKEVEGAIEFDQVLLNTQSALEDKLMVLQGWIPAVEAEQIASELDKASIYYEITNPTPDDNVPIKFANKGFFSWFEPIGKLYMLPRYNEIDLTPYFAPFFMVFFGLCLGDSGYGLFLLLVATLYKMFAKKLSPSMRSVMSLVQVLGTSTFFCGLLTGGFFGVSLYDIDNPFIQWVKSFAYKDNNEMFALALILGVIQILFGMCLKIANQIIQFGFKYAVATIGWFVFLTYTCLVTAFPSIGSIGDTVYLSISGVCAAMVFLFNSPDKNIFTNIGLGLWDTYNMATGLLGDVLSYVRLFALGLSGGILASVFNSLATGMSPDNIILGPIVMVLIFVVGHGINIFMNVLGAMVHPMRLTFVEFFKNAGYEGGGQEYKPFKNK